MSAPARDPVLDGAPFTGGRTTMIAASIASAIGLALFLLGCAADLTQALAGYLIAYFYAVTVVLGLMGFVMGAYAMGAKWPAAIRRAVELGFGTMPLLLVLYAPLLLSAERLYPWMHPERVADHATRALVIHKQRVMNAPMFYGRAILFLILWTVMAEVLRRGSDRCDDRDTKERLKGFSSVALPLLGTTGTFAAFDWVMSLSPDFYSTMFGLYALTGGFVASIGLVAITLRACQTRGYLANVNRSHWYAVGRLLFAFLVFWAYTGFFQLLLIWIANKPIEVKFYIERLQPGDLGTSWFLIVGHFALPFLVLLSYAVKRSRGAITALGAWVLACHYVDIHWLVAARRGARDPWSWQDVAPLVFIGGACVAFALLRQRGRSLAATNDPDYAVALEYESH